MNKPHQRAMNAALKNKPKPKKESKMKVFAIIALFTPYVYNAVKLVDCDFESPYKCEVIHGIGAVMPPAAWVTVWFSTDAKED